MIQLPARWLPTRLRGEPDVAMWIAMAFAVALIFEPSGGRPIPLVATAALLAAIVIGRRWRLAWLGIVVLLGVGIALRLAVTNHTASDVMDVTGSALRNALHGVNPWGHGFLISRPPGAPFPYGPLALFWYLPAVNDPRQVELFVGCAVLALLAVHGRPVGLAVYATVPIIVLNAADGSNDTSAGLLILVAFILAGKRPWLGAVGIAVAVAFKPYAAAWVPGLVLFGGVTAFQAFLATSLLLWTPPIVAWGLTNFISSLQQAESIHNAPYWSFGIVWEAITRHSAPRDLLDTGRLVVGTAAMLVGLRFARSLDAVIVAGIVVFLIVMLGGYWGSYAYFGAIAPVICWRLDDWLRIPAPAFLAGAPWAPAPPAAVSSPR